MKKIYDKLFAICGIMILVFILAFIVGGFILKDNNVIWKVFSVVMPITAICFWGGVILWVIDKLRGA